MYTEEDVDSLWSRLSDYKERFPGEPGAWPVRLFRAQEAYAGVETKGGLGLLKSLTFSFDVNHMSPLTHHASGQMLKRIEGLWEETLENVPRYVNDESSEVSCLARWRLEIGK